jgi:hypothetical protein
LLNTYLCSFKGIKLGNSIKFNFFIASKFFIADIQTLPRVGKNNALLFDATLKKTLVLPSPPFFPKQKALVSDSLTRAYVFAVVVRTGIEPVFHP